MFSMSSVRCLYAAPSSCLRIRRPWAFSRRLGLIFMAFCCFEKGFIFIYEKKIIQTLFKREFYYQFSWMLSLSNCQSVFLFDMIDNLADIKRVIKRLNLNSKMIGRKISDQTITCKVIKPIQLVVNPNSNPNIVKGQSPSKQSTKIVNMNYEPIQQTHGRVFGMNNKEVQVEVDIGLGYENQFNRLNHFEKERNALKSDKDIAKSDFNNGSSRNVTHFFINHKEKPINVEVVKKTTQINKNSTNLAGSTEIKKYTQTPKTEDANLKVTINEKDTGIEKKSTNTIHTNNSSLTDNKAISNKSGLAEKNNAKTSTHLNQEKSLSKHSTKMNNERTQSNKQPLSINQNSSKLIASNSREKLSTHKQSIPLKNKQEDSSVKRLTQKSAKKEDHSVQKNRSSVSVKKGQNARQKVSQKDMRKIDEISFHPWQQISQEPSLCIENYEPDSSYLQVEKDQAQTNTKVQNNHTVLPIKPNHQVKHTNKSQPNKRFVPQKPVTNQTKPPQKRYMSVKEEIQEKLKEKKLRQQELQMRKREIEEQRKQHEKQEKMEDKSQDNDFSQENEEEQVQRAEIPEPILMPKEHITESSDQYPQTKMQTDKMLQQDETDKLNSSRLIYNEIMADLQGNKLPSNLTSQLKYNYIESSDEQENQKQQSSDGQELQGQSQMVKFKNDYDQQMADQLQKFKRFEEDLEQELSFRHQNHSQMHQAEQDAELFEDQQIVESIKLGEVKNLNMNKELKGNQYTRKQISTQQINIKKPTPSQTPSLTINKTQTKQKQTIKRQQDSEEQSDEEQEEQNNPKLLQYLKKRNLISSNKPTQTPKNQKSSVHSSSKLKITEILNSNQLSSGNHQRQVIIELDEQYLQSSIIASSRKEVNQIHANNEQEDQYDMSVDLPAARRFYQQHQNLNQVNICDSSDSQQGTKQPLYSPPPFVNFQNQPHLDQLFDLNLQSLLKKQFIQLK